MRASDATFFTKTGIRGRIEGGLTPAFGERLGRAFGRFLRGITHPLASAPASSEVAVAWDCRLSSSVLAASVVRGLRASGADVVRFGTCPTALWNFGVFGLSLGGGVMVTGAEAGLEFNGFELRRAGGRLTQDELEEVKELMRKDECDPTASRGGVADRNLLPAYVACHSGHAERKRKILIDTANGTVGPMARAVFRARGEIESLNAGVNGRFPARHPFVRDERELAGLYRAVRDRGFDLGFSLDGDSNQLVVVEPSGRVTHVSSVLAEHGEDAVHAALRFLTEAS